MKSLFKAVALITVFSILTRIAGFLFRIYLARAIGEVELGLYQIAFSIFVVLLTVVSSGLPLTVSKLSAQYEAKHQRGKQNSMVTASLIVGGLVACLLCAVLLLFNKYLTVLFPDSRCVLILISLLPAVVFSSAYSVFRGVLWGHNKYFIVCLTELIEQLSRIIICVLALSFLFSTVDGSLVASISLSIACMISFIIITIAYFKHGYSLASPKGAYKEVIAPSASITGVRLLSSLIQPLVAIIVPMRMISAGFTNEQALTQFGIAMGMTYPLLFLPSTLVGSLAMALIPDLASANASNNKQHISSRIQTSLLFSFFVACICVPVYMALGEPICEFLFDNTQAGSYLANSAWTMIPICVSSISTTILNALCLEVKSMKNYIVGAIFMLICLWVLPAYIGVESMIVGMGGCMLITTLLNFRMIGKVIPDLKYGLKSVILILLVLPTTLLTQNVYGLLSFILPNFVNIVICGLLSVATYALLCQIFNVVEIKSFFIKLKNNTKIKTKNKV